MPCWNTMLRIIVCKKTMAGTWLIPPKDSALPRNLRRALNLLG
jgi:hypothetical protein